jgi:hypothetical protein
VWACLMYDCIYNLKAKPRCVRVGGRGRATQTSQPTIHTQALRRDMLLTFCSSAWAWLLHFAFSVAIVRKGEARQMRERQRDRDTHREREREAADTAPGGWERGKLRCV